MSGTNRKRKLSVMLAASLITANFVCASDAYKNNVVDVRVNKESSSAVKVTIYTDKPYTEPVVVNKKANNKYVILMPETKSSLKGSPTVTNGSGTISNVTVNTQDVSGGKGYTKIIITSEKAITVVPKTKQLNSSTSKPTKQTTATTTKPVTKPITAATTKPAATTPKVAQTTTKPTVAKKAESKATTQQPTKKANVTKKPTQKTVKPTVEKTAQVTKPVVTKPPQEKKQPIEILEQEVKTGQYAQIKQDANDEFLNNTIKNNMESKGETFVPEKEQPVNEEKKSVLENIKTVIKDYQNISLWKILLLASAITFPIIVIMLILNLDKKINKKIDRTFKREEEYSTEPQQIQENNNIETTSPYNSFDDMLDKIDTPEEIQIITPETKESTSTPEIDNILTEMKNETLVKESSQFNNDYVDADFEHDFADAPVEESVEPPANTIEPVNTSKEEKQEFMPPAEEYNPDGYLSDFTGVNDNDFFDELVLQTMADNNTNGLPEESPADEIFSCLNDTEEQKEEPIMLQETTPTIEESVVKEPPIEETIENVQSYPIEQVEEPKEISEAENLPQETSEEEIKEEDITMLTEAKINDTTSLYLVNYDNFSSLVGHIGDDYFVVKKFDEIVNSKIILKETEKLKDSTRYLVRVGRSKMVVEVTENSMNRLLDL